MVVAYFSSTHLSGLFIICEPRTREPVLVWSRLVALRVSSNRRTIQAITHYRYIYIYIFYFNPYIYIYILYYLYYIYIYIYIYNTGGIYIYYTRGIYIYIYIYRYILYGRYIYLFRLHLKTYLFGISYPP